MMSNGKKWRTFLGVSVLTVIAVVVSACSSGAKPAENKPAAPAAEAKPEPKAEPKGEVKMWTGFAAGGEAAGIKQILDLWQTKNSPITINHRPIGNEQFETVVRTGLNGGDAPDLLQFEGYAQTRSFAAAGQLTDLTQWWNANKSRYVVADSLVKACEYQGKVWCVPYSMHTGFQIYYNADILAKYNIAVPKDYDEFLAAAETLKKNGVTPIAFGDKEGWPGEHYWMAFLVQRCGVDTTYKAINRQGAKFSDACFTQAAADFQNLAKKGYFSPGAASDTYSTAQAYFLSGKAAFFQTGSWHAANWVSKPPTFKAGIMPFPRLKDAAVKEDQTGAVTHVIAVPAGGKNKDAAMKVLDFLVSDEVQKLWAQAGQIALVKGAVEAGSPETVKQMWAQFSQAKASLPWIENELPPGVGPDKVYNGTTALVSGAMTPEQFTKSIEDAVAAAK
ncbi:MAG TPA: extracellular solute-binding protein [Symbiobacteriaceae bacterium]|nr:extracellular solute-binding protein [Symbiobacteriaceae bacterium]